MSKGKTVISAIVYDPKCVFESYTYMFTVDKLLTETEANKFLQDRRSNLVVVERQNVVAFCLRYEYEENN